jgi:hypothetical protein
LVVVAPEQTWFVEFGHRVAPWQHGSPFEPQHTPWLQPLLGQLVHRTQVSLAVLQSTVVPPDVPLHWRTL